MPKTEQLAEQLKVLDAYGQDTDPYGTIRDSISKRVYDDLRPEHERVAHYEQSQLPTFYGALSSGYGMGTGRGDLSPEAALHAATQDVARQSAAAQASRGILDTRGASMEDLIGRTHDAYQHGYGMQQDAYNRLWQQQQHADDLAMQREQMALKERLAAAQRASAQRAAAQPDWISLLEKMLGGGQSQPKFFGTKHSDLLNKGINVNPETGNYIVGRSMPGGYQETWERETGGASTGSGYDAIGRAIGRGASTGGGYDALMKSIQPWRK